MKHLCAVVALSIIASQTVKADTHSLIAQLNEQENRCAILEKVIKIMGQANLDTYNQSIKAWDDAAEFMSKLGSVLTSNSGNTSEAGSLLIGSARTAATNAENFTEMAVVTERYRDVINKEFDYCFKRVRP